MAPWTEACGLSSACRRLESQRWPICWQVTSNVACTSVVGSSTAGPCEAGCTSGRSGLMKPGDCSTYATGFGQRRR